MQSGGIDACNWMVPFHAIGQAIQCSTSELGPRIVDVELVALQLNGWLITYSSNIQP